MIYLAQPYTDPNPDVRKHRFNLGERYTAELLQNGQWVYSPIVHCHELAKKYDLPSDFEYWKDHNFHMLGCSNVVFALLLDGWQDSQGMFNEIQQAIFLNITVRVVEIHNGEFFKKGINPYQFLPKFTHHRS